MNKRGIREYFTNLALVEGGVDSAINAIKESNDVSVKRHPIFKNLLHFSYGIKTNFKRKWARECRGAILDSENEFNYVCRPYNKFFNYGEQFAAHLHSHSTRVYEKCDGTMICLWYYNNDWHISTTGTPDAGGSVGDNKMSFANLFWDVWEQCEFILPDNDNELVNGDVTEFTYLFELMTPFNRVVVEHYKNNIVLHGVRHNESGIYVPHEQPAFAFGWSFVEPNTSIPNVLMAKEAAEKLDPLKQEGYVLVDGYGRRLKVKSPQYVRLHHLKSNLTDRGMLEIVRNNEGPEFLNYFPECKTAYAEMSKKFVVLCEQITQEMLAREGINSQKEFAISVQALPYSSIMFNLRNNKINSVFEGLREMPIKKLEELIGGINNSLDN